MSNIIADLELLDRGILPAAFCYDLKCTEEIDFTMLEYNSKYKTPQWHFYKLPPAIREIPNIEKLCAHIAEISESPLRLMMERQAIEENESNPWAYRRK